MEGGFARGRSGLEHPLAHLVQRAVGVHHQFAVENRGLQALARVAELDCAAIQLPGVARQDELNLREKTLLLIGGPDAADGVTEVETPHSDLVEVLEVLRQAPDVRGAGHHDDEMRRTGAQRAFDARARGRVRVQPAIVGGLVAVVVLPGPVHAEFQEHAALGRPLQDGVVEEDGVGDHVEAEVLAQRLRAARGVGRGLAHHLEIHQGLASSEVETHAPGLVAQKEVGSLQGGRQGHERIALEDRTVAAAQLAAPGHEELEIRLQRGAAAHATA